MKRNLLLAIATLLLAGSSATAQDWKEALKKAATTAADKATDGKLTQYALAGTWNYTAPGVKFEGNDLLSQLGGTVLQDNIKQQLDKGYQMAGIKPGAGTVTFAKDGKFTTLMGKYELSGTYEFDASTHVARSASPRTNSIWVRFRGTPTSTALICCWSSPSPNSSTWSRRWAAKYRRWRPSSRCSKTTKTSTSASNSAAKREKMRSRRKKLHFFSNDRFTTDLSFFITDFHPRSVPSRRQ